MKHLYISIFTICLLTICADLFSQQPEIKVNNKKNISVIELNGNGHERGLQHGKVLKTEIAEVFLKWKKFIQQQTNSNADTIINNFLKVTNFEPAIRKHTPELYEETKGIAEGSGQSFKDVFCFQLVDEFWVYVDSFYNVKNHHCSGIGVAATKTNPAYISQNMDLESYRNGYQTLLHIAATKNEPEQYILSCAGLIALNGVNSKGIGLCVNTLMQLTASTNGLPVAYVIRGVLSKKNGESALKFLKTVPHASGQNYIIGLFDKVYDFEASANKVIRYLPDPSNETLVYHTNHPISNDDIKPWHKEFLKKVLSGGATDDNSIIRFTSLKNRLTIPTLEVNDKVLKEVLISKDNLKNPVCLNYNEGYLAFTFSSVIFTLGKKPTIQVTNGSPDQSEYVLHKFNSNK